MLLNEPYNYLERNSIHVFSTENYRKLAENDNNFKIFRMKDRLEILLKRSKELIYVFKQSGSYILTNIF